MTKKLSRKIQDDLSDHNVGYGKPPKHTQFKPGQSGNPKGRPRGQRNLKTVINEVLKERITIREGERTRNVSKLDALARVAINNALKGDLKAFFQIARSIGLMEAESIAPDQDIVGADDEAILAAFLDRHENTWQRLGWGPRNGCLRPSLIQRTGVTQRLRSIVPTNSLNRWN